MKSHINLAKFTKRIPTEQFGYEEYSLEAAIDPSETGEEVLVEMRSQVSAAFAADLVKASDTEKELKAAKKAAKKEEKKNAKPGKSKARPSDDEDEDREDSDSEDASTSDESSDDDEASDDQDGDNDHDSSDDSEDEESSDDGYESEEGDADDGDSDEEDTKPAKGKSSSKSSGKTEGKKSFRKKPQVYNRQLEQHKDIFGRLLRSVSPDWSKSDKLKVVAKKASETLEGSDFLDENGEVLPVFKAEVKRLMAVKAKAK